MKKIYKIFSVVFALILTFSSCEEQALLDLNVNKNAVADIEMDYLFSLGTLRLAGEYENTRAVSLYSSTMIQHTSSLASYFSGDKYYYSAQYSGAYMEAQYTGIIRLFSHVITKTEGVDSEANLNAAATILKAFNLQRMTDLYGDIPYMQAGKGLEDPENWFPKYDDQKTLYYTMVDEVKAARDKFSSSARDLGVQDFLYGGDISKWQKFANSLLMRIAMRMSNVDPEKAKEVFLEANSNGTFIENNDTAFIKFAEGPQGINRNGLNDGYWNTYKYSKDCKISKTFMDWMISNNDPRLMIIAGGLGYPEVSSTWVTDPAAQKGMPNGYTSTTIKNILNPADLADFNTNGNNMYSMLNIKYLDWSDPYALITYAEVELMKAEASVNGWTADDANMHFTNGVTAAIKSWTSFDASFARTDTEIDSYIQGRGFETATTLDKLRLIGEEYWAATYLNDIESYSNWRRTGFPALTPTQDPGRYEENQIPRRLKYWEAEIANNPTNYTKAVERMGGDKFMTRVWWDGGN